jgi:hypothetical protein
MCVYYIHHSLCGTCFKDLTYGLCTYNFQMCITSELLWNTSNSALTLETCKIIFLKNVLIPQVGSYYACKRQLDYQLWK